MKKEDFIKLLEQAKTDKHGRLYLDGKYHNKVYFGLVTAICADPFDEYGCDDDEIYDRHWWNDDTLEINGSIFDNHVIIFNKALQER